MSAGRREHAWPDGSFSIAQILSPSSFPITLSLSPPNYLTLSLCPCGNFLGWPFRGTCVCVCGGGGGGAESVGAQVCWSIMPSQGRTAKSLEAWSISPTHTGCGNACPDQQGPTVNSHWFPDGNWVSQGRLAPASSRHPFSARHSLCIYSN